MDAKDTTLRRDILRITAWTAVFPALALWPILSALPAFSLLAGTGGSMSAAAQALLLITGFWGVATLAGLYWFLLSETERVRRSANRSQKGLIIGGYATLWTGVYMIVALALR
jgi:hypothetical protein